MILPVERVAENDKGAQRSGALGAPGPGPGSRVPGPGVRGPWAGSRVPGPRAPGPGPGHRHTETDTDTASPVAHLRPLLRTHSDTHRHTATDIYAGTHTARQRHSDTHTLTQRHTHRHRHSVARRTSISSAERTQRPTRKQPQTGRDGHCDTEIHALRTSHC